VQGAHSTEREHGKIVKMATLPMAVVKPIIINETLCFLTRKIGCYPAKQIKSLLFEFYSAELVSEAKDVLFEALNVLNVNGAPKTSRRRRDSKDNPEAKIRLDVDDLMTAMAFVDENKLIDQLPLYVAANPDLIPSPRLLEGDLVALLAKLVKIEERCTSIQTELDETRSVISKTAAVGCGCQCSVGASLVNKRLLRVGKGKGGSIASPTYLVQGQDTGSEDHISEMESEGEVEGSDSQGFGPSTSKAARRNAKKRKRASNSPPYVSYAAKVAKNLATTDSVIGASITAAQNTASIKAARRKQIVIGHSTTATMKAAKHLNLPKSIYRIGNIDACYSADDLTRYVEKFGVRVLSCFERTSEKSRFTDNKTFRLCIYDADKEKLLNDGNWGVGISIQKWMFKPKPTVVDLAVQAATAVLGGGGSWIWVSQGRYGHWGESDGGG
jgi:hypothetical protein